MNTPIETIQADCLVCGRRSAFDSFEPIDFPCKRNSFFCRNCGSNARNRHVARLILEMFAPHTRAENLSDFAGRTQISILHTCASGAIHDCLRRAANYCVSEFYEDCHSGHIRDGVVCQNLEQTTFPDASFDLVITEDVLEHIADPARACRELRRILKPNGCHIATVPVFWEKPQSATRAVHRNGRTEHLLEPQYHGDPNRPDGVLVYTDFGQDLVDAFLSLTGPTRIHESHQNREDESRFAIYNNWVFVSRKI